MAIDDTTLKAEVRLLTNYDETIVSPSKLQELVDLAKRELEGSTQNSSLNFYGDITTERALFWLTCIYCKIRAGEIDSPSFKIGEIDFTSYDPDDEVGMWFDNFWKYYLGIGGGAPVGHIKNNRQDRSYGFDN
jgi:hypothetical protein